MAILKKSLFLSLFLCSLAFGEGSQNIQVIGPFSGLNNADNPAALATEKAQDLLNVDLSLGGRSVLKRKGYGLAYALSITTSPVHGVYEFYDANGNDVTLAFNDSRMTSTVNGGSISVLFSTGINGATYQCTDSQGFAYCVNSSRTNLVKTNGTTYSFITNVLSTGTMVAVTPDRLVLSGFSDAPNRIDFSAAADFTSWTTGIGATSAYSFTITAPGPKITHICYAFNRIMWFKSNSFGYILQGQNASEWIVRTVSPNVGTLDNTSIFYQGILYFRGSDSHIWEYDGTNLQKLSRDIGGTVDSSQNRTSNFWTQTSLEDWNTGSFDSGVFVDTTSVSGNIQTLFPDDFSTVRDGSNGTKRVWNANSSVGIIDTISTTTVSTYMYSGKVTLTASPDRYVSIYNNSSLSNYSSGTTFYMDVTASSGGINSGFSVILSTYVKTTNFNLFATGAGPRVYFQGYGDGVNFHPYRFDSSCGVSSTTFSITSFPIPTSISLFISSNNYQANIGTTTVIYGNNACSQPFSYLYLHQGTQSSSLTSYSTIDNFNVIPETFTFVSSVKNAPSLTSWDAFTANYSLGSSSQTFSIRAASGAFTTNSSTPSWTTITNGQVPTISTGTYFQIRDYFNYYSTGSAVSSLSDFTQNWLEGQATDKSYATYFKDAIYFSVASGTGATTNNRLLKWDLLNQAWLIYDLPVNGFYVKNNELYFGSSGSGNVFKYGDVDNDNGSPINAYWKSKDFFNGSPFTDDDLTDLSIFFKAVNNSTMTVTYTLVGGTSASYNVPMQRTTAQFGNYNKNLPLGTVGNTFNVKFGNNSADQNFEVFSIQYGWQPKSWKPSQ